MDVWSSVALNSFKGLLQNFREEKICLGLEAMVVSKSEPK